MNKVKLIVVIILSIAAGIFAYQNIIPVPILFLRWSTELPQALLLFGALLIGYFIGVIQMLLHARKKRKLEKKAQQQPVDDQVAAGEVAETDINAKGVADVIITPTSTYPEQSSTSDTGGRS